ncbi:MAG: TrkH family potassium uptake protein [Hyphomicrobium sp.]|nr:TrkH family potassium uptake protein [Hyphomicrobium sp.]
MVQLRPILLPLGLMLCAVAAAMLLPALVDLADRHQGWQVFVASALATFFAGGLLVLLSYDDRPTRLGLKDGFLFTTLAWVVVAGFGAIPFIGQGMTVTDAYFETMSGLTTTGSTVISGLENQPRGLLLWRCMLCGIGGLGIIAVAIIVLPFLRVGGMQLFQTESSDKSEKILPRAVELTAAIAGVYFGLILLCAIAYAFAGMSVFDAVCHSLSTVATGGFANYDASFAKYDSVSIEVVGSVFMVLGALPFVALIKALRGDGMSLWTDVQIRGFIMFLVAVSVILALWLTMTREMSFLQALRLSSFNVVSIVTTTGFMSDDYQLWGNFALGVFFILTLVGGCSGSTSGAIKIYRLQIAGILTRGHFVHLISPNRVVTMSYNGRRLPPDVPFSVIAFLVIYLGTIGIVAVLLTALGLDLVTALTASATALGNVGPGLGPIIGPAGNFTPLPDAAKWVLSFQMLLGRLELFTVLVLLRPEFWRS